MNIHQFTSPRHTYDGYFETYFIRPFFHQYANFKDKESGRTCALSLLAWLIVTLGVSGIMMGQIGLIGPDAGITSTIVVLSIWFAASIVPIAAIITRFLHGAPEKEHKPRMLGVDTLLAVSCILFFILGLLMMLTTLNSEILNPNSRYVPEDDTAAVEEDYVVEEPIFTYQDEVTTAPEIEKDTLSDVNEADLVSPEESFDPTIENPSDPVIEEPVSDSI
ncbi:MAG: hypothetical protein HDS71_08930 [Bacteroidales bacterium]|nr:hypothetical protein [Bacteroidales bacterium]MBD5205198.1 hypothetical protein [Bacteroidales bacterium]MBD5224147.1 hypothetical protein [Bacteroidales bacterium]MBD5302815.1 hypothetical protein [Bacteroides sp.]